MEQISPPTPGQYLRGFRVSQILQSARSISSSYHRDEMQRVDVYLKVELEVEDKDSPEKLAGEICRQLMKNYGVRSAEVSNLIEKE
jgi:hypothetical protein